jgi:chemotaxis protein MotB
MPGKNIGIFLFVTVLTPSLLSMGCGVSKKIHQSVLNNLESVKAELSSTRAQKESLDKETQELKRKLDDLESTLAARNTELEALRQQNLELMNARNNLMAEVEDLQARTGQLTEAKNKEIEKLKGTYDSLVSELKDEIKKGEIKVTQVLDRLSVNMVEKILFDSGSADLKPEGLKVLERLGGVLKKVKDKQIRVEGHTDNVPIGGKLAEKFPTNWELSAVRATNVVKFLTERVGVDPKLMMAAAYSMNRPVASNDTKDGRAQNRRIEIALIPMNIDRVLKDLQ